MMPAHPVAILVAIIAVAAAAGCGSHNFSDSGPSTELLSGATAAAGSRIVTRRRAVQLPGAGALAQHLAVHGWERLGQDPVPLGDRAGLGTDLCGLERPGHGRPPRTGDAVRQELKRLGMSVESVSAALVGNSPAFVFDINDVPVPGGGTGSARRILIFTPQAIINVTCQWTDQADQKTTLAGCDSVRSSMRVS